MNSNDLTDPSGYRLWTTERVRFADTDMFGHVNHAVFATYFEVGRSSLGLSSTARVLIPPGAGSVVRVLTVNYLGEVKYPSETRIGTRIGRVGNSSFTVEQVLLVGDKAVATAEVVYILANLATGRSTPIPPDLRAHLESCERPV